MILSASRRTDIPAFYSKWLVNRLRAGYVLSRNPMNHSQVSKISLSPDIIDCIVFWTKDPANMLARLSSIDEMLYRYYFQFTLTPYDNKIEKNMRCKEEILQTFIELGKRIGRDRLLWRYDPIILNDTISISEHEKWFKEMCAVLHPYTNSVTISFVDLYAKVKTPLVKSIGEPEKHHLAGIFSAIAGEYGLTIKACCEQTDFSSYGIAEASCIDRETIESICGCKVIAPQDKNQRKGCNCLESVDIGAYNTCKNGCVYCYANFSEKTVISNWARHDPGGEFLLGRLLATDKVTERKMNSIKYA